MTSKDEKKQSQTASMNPVGLGFWKIPKKDSATLFQSAVKAGYRHFDFAADYGNEKEIGVGIKAVLESGIVKRSELFITSKLWNTYHSAKHVRAACQKSLDDLGLDYVDLYVIHFPISLKFVPFEKRYPPEWIHDPEAKEPKMEMDDVPISETWGEMEKLQKDGLAKQIGVSNFNCSLLRDLLSYATIKPACLQVELHPYLAQERLLRFCAQKGIQVVGYSPLGSGSYVEIGGAKEDESPLKQECVQAIAKKYNKSPGQVVLRWGTQRGYAVIPKTTKEARLKENLDIFDFTLSDEDMKQITGLDKHRRYNDPGAYTPSMNCYYPIFD